MSTWKWELSQRDWENESTSTKWPWLMSSWIKCGLSQMRPDCSFTSSRLRAGPPGCRSCLATWRGESEMDSARDQSSSSDFRLCCGNRALRCDGVWTPKILRCWLTSDPGERGRRYEKKKNCDVLSVYGGDRKCHRSPASPRSWLLVICWKETCHGDVWLL